MRSMVGKAFVDDSPMPLLEWDLIDVRRNRVPELLDVLDLLVNRQRLEPRRRNKWHLWHGEVSDE